MLSFKKTQALALTLFVVLTFSFACTHRAFHQVGSHKVTIARHGFQKSLDIEKRGGVDTLEYRGVSTTGTKLTVVISGDRVKVNGVNAGTLREGDSVTIGDDGVAVNFLDYGESAKYLKANGGASEAAELR